MGVETHEDNERGVIGTEGAGQFCLSTTLAGKRCRAIPLAGGYCFAHAPELAEKRKAAQQAGGRAISERRRVLVGIVSFDTPEAVRQFFEGLARAVLRGEILPSKGLAASQIGEAALRVKAGIELGERLDSLESRIQSLVEGRFGPGAGGTR